MAILRANSGSIDMTLNLAAYIPPLTGVQLTSANVGTTGTRFFLSNGSQIALHPTMLEIIDSPGPNGPVDLTITGNFSPIATPIRSALITAGARVNGPAISGPTALTALGNVNSASTGTISPASITISRVDASGPRGSYTLEIATDLQRIVDVLVPLAPNISTPAGIIQPGLAAIFDGPDSYIGGSGNDIFVLYGGNDTVDGGGGIDSIRIAGSSTTTTVVGSTVRLPDGSVVTVRNVENLQFNDRVVTVSGSAFSRDASGNVICTPGPDRVDLASGSVGNGSDTIFGLAGDDTIFGAGSGSGIANADWLIGDAGNDQLFGEAGDDVLFGRTGNDSLAGGDAVDLIFGEEGNDTLNGGRGQDALLGGTGADRFVLTADPGNANLEGIFDFNRAEGDRIQFDPAAFAVKTAAAAVAAQFTIPGIVLIGGQQIQTLYTAINFGTTADPQILLLGGNPTLITSDFILGG